MYRTRSPDTERALEERLIERYRATSPAERLEHVGALGRLAEEAAPAALHARYPDATEAENRLRRLDEAGANDE